MPKDERKKTTVHRLFFQREEKFAREWDAVKPEGERKLIPPGRYEATLVDGEAFEARTGTPGYRLTFALASGEFRNRQVSMRLWLTIDAAPRTKAVLAKVGLGPRFRDLDGDVPKGLRVALYVTTAESKSGRVYNEVEDFEPIDGRDARPPRGRGPIASPGLNDEYEYEEEEEDDDDDRFITEEEYAALTPEEQAKVEIIIDETAEQPVQTPKRRPLR